MLCFLAALASFASWLSYSPRFARAYVGVLGVWYVGYDLAIRGADDQA